MANKQRKREDGNETFQHAFTAGDVFYIGDALGQVAGKAVPASDFTYGGGGTYATLALAQEAFAKVFLGVSRQASRSTDTFTTVVIDGYGVFEFDTASASYAVGDLVGMAGNTTPTPDALHDQKVAAVSLPCQAIGTVFKATSSETKVLVKIFPRVLTGQSVGPRTYKLAIPVFMASIATGNYITGLRLGHPFKIIDWEWHVTQAVTTGAKAATMNLEIDGVDVTDGTLVISGAYAIGAAKVTTGTAPSALNTGTATSVIDIEAASVTAFAEGAGVFTLTIQDLS